MQGPGGTGHDAASHRPDVIGIDLQAHRVLPGRVDDQIRRKAGQGLRQCHIGATVNDPHRLKGARISRHGRTQVIRPDIRDFNAKMTDHGLVSHLAQTG